MKITIFHQLQFDTVKIPFDLKELLTSKSRNMNLKTSGNQEVDPQSSQFFRRNGKLIK